MPDKRESQYAALAPIMAMAGMFVDPKATTLLPFILFFFFHWRQMDFARLVALRAADLAFTAQFFMVLADVGIKLYSDSNPMPVEEIRSLRLNILWGVFLYLLGSYIIATVQAFRGQHFKYLLSLRVAERVFDILSTRARR